MSYTPTYAPDDLTGITTDSVAKFVIAAGSMAAIVVLVLLLYFLFKRRR